MNSFLKSIGDLFAKDIPAGLKVVGSDIVHLGHLIGAFVVGGMIPFFMSDIFPTFKGQLMIQAADGGVNTSGVITALTSATLTALWTLALKAPANSIVAQVATNIPQGAVDSQIAKVSQDVGNAGANAIKKIVPLIMAFFIVGVVSANPIGVPLPTISPNGDNMWLAMPFTNVNTYTSNGSTNYGLGMAYGIAFANVTAQTQTTVNIMPYFFIAPYVSAELADWINSNGQSAWTIDYGLMLGLPKLDSSIPEVSITINKNSTTGSATTLGIATSFPTDVLADVFVRKLIF